MNRKGRASDSMNLDAGEERGERGGGFCPAPPVQGRGEGSSLLSPGTPLSVGVRGIRKDFVKGGDTIRVLKGVDLDIEPGDILSIEGASGVGKSTFLQILGLLDTPTQGEILFNGTDPLKLPENRKALIRNRLIGFVFQFHYLLREFTALENAMLPGIIAGISREEIARMARKILEEVGLGERMGHRPGELSGGEQQRVAVARALILKPKMVLADEPTGNLDPSTGQKVLDLLLHLNREKGISTVIVTHNPDVSERISRRYRLMEGRLHTIKGPFETRGEGII